MGNSVCSVGNGGSASTGDSEPLCCISPRLRCRMKRINCRPTYRHSSQDVAISPNRDDFGNAQRTSHALLVSQQESLPTWGTETQISTVADLEVSAETVEETKRLKFRNAGTLPLKLKNLIAAPSMAGNNSLLPIVDDDDFCPTCLDGYDSNNPKTLTRCKHHYHLPCILEWLERSKTFPMCNQEMIFNGQS